MTDFDEFVAAHVDDLLRTAYLIVWDEGEAEDLVQECLLKIARRWPRIRRMDHSGPTPGGFWSISRSMVLAAARSDVASWSQGRQAQARPPSTRYRRWRRVPSCYRRLASCASANGPCSSCATSTT